jgi:ubiquinone/menaquinone biosynthesis C-methylase UbiE
MTKTQLSEVREYWSDKNVPQKWYSDKHQLSLAWFNEIRYQRYTKYYEYLWKDAEFQFHQGEEVLEVGCGIGTDLAEYALNGAIVTGVDLGIDQVNLTRLNLETRGLKYKEIKQSNAEELDFPDCSFDLVYSFGVLHHTPNTKQAIHEIHRVLKDDGKTIVMLYARGWKHYLKRCFLHGLIYGKYFKHGCDWSKVYAEVSEVNGNSPKSDIYTKKQVELLFSNFSQVEIHKRRMGEFFEYAPYRTLKFPKIVNSICFIVGAEFFFGENWIIKASKAAPPPKTSVLNVLFKHY